MQGNGVPQEVLDRLDRLSQQIGEGVDYFWPAAVGATFTKGLSNILVLSLPGVFLLLLSVYCLLGLRRRIVSDGEFDLDVSEQAGFSLVSVGSFLLGGALLLLAINSAPMVVYPEWAALKELVRMVR